MKFIDVQAVLAEQDESLTLELKKSTAQLRACMETLCAFLNCSGGLVLIGVNDNKEIIGQTITDKTKRELANELAKLAPAAPIEIDYVALAQQDKQVIAIRAMPDSAQRPYTYDGRAFVRTESSTHKMSREYYHNLIMQNVNTQIRWEDLPMLEASLEDLDHGLIFNTVKKGLGYNRIPVEYDSSDVEEILRHFNLMKYDKITHAAMVLFGKKPQQFLPQCLLKLAKFRGKDKSHFEDNRQVHGNVFTLLNEGLAFVSRYLPIASYFPKDSIQREDVPLFPPDVIREALVNAICHRDYSMVGSNISIGVYQDRIEVWNYGKLPPGVTVEGIESLAGSFPRNPHIANVLFYHKLFESWGRGVSLIFDGCVESGHPKPYYKEGPIGTYLVLPSKQSLSAPILEQSDTIKPQEKQLTPLQEEMLAILQNGQPLQLSQVMQNLQQPVPERTVQRALNQLKKEELIDQIGGGRAVAWVLKIKTP